MKNVHGDFGYGSMKIGVFSGFCTQDLLVANTRFKKRDSHLVTYITIVNGIKIDYFLTKVINKSSCLNCKVIPRE